MRIQEYGQKMDINTTTCKLVFIAFAAILSALPCASAFLTPIQQYQYPQAQPIPTVSHPDYHHPPNRLLITFLSSTNEKGDTPTKPARIGKRQTIVNLAKSIVNKNASKAATAAASAAAVATNPQAIGKVLVDAAGGAVEMSTVSPNDPPPTVAIETPSVSTTPPQVPNEPPSSSSSSDDSSGSGSLASLRMQVESTFAVADQAVQDAQENLKRIQQSLDTAKFEALTAIEAAESQLQGRDFTLPDMPEAFIAAPPIPSTEEEEKVTIDDLSYEDVNYEMSEMAPPFIGEDMCLVPGVPLVRVEKAPENSRRIFAGIDILASVDEVWNVS